MRPGDTDTNALPALRAHATARLLRRSKIGTDLVIPNHSTLTLDKAMPTPAPRHARSTRASMLVVTALLSACSGGEDGSNGVEAGLLVERSMDGDTAVVQVLAGSTWGAEAELVPEVTIGVLEGDDRYIFGGIRSLAVDGTGRIFVMDGQLTALRVYDPDGNWIDD